MGREDIGWGSHGKHHWPPYQHQPYQLPQVHLDDDKERDTLSLILYLMVVFQGCFCTAIGCLLSMFVKSQFSEPGDETRCVCATIDRVTVHIHTLIIASMSDQPLHVLL